MLGSLVYDLLVLLIVVIIIIFLLKFVFAVFMIGNVYDMAYEQEQAQLMLSTLMRR